MDTYRLNGCQLVSLQLYLINTIMLEGFNLNIILKSLKNTNMLFFGSKIINIFDNHMKAAEFQRSIMAKIMHCAYVCTKNITKFCSSRWYHYLLWPMDYEVESWPL